MGEKELRINVVNYTPFELVVESKTNLTSGEWVVAPTNVSGFSQGGSFLVVNNGSQSGVEGTIYYSMMGAEISLIFKDPVEGSNYFDSNCTSEQFLIEHKYTDDGLVGYAVVPKL